MAVLVKTVNGLAYASVKTRNGLAVASAKTMNGVDVTSGGGFSPTDISGCILWLKADSLSLSDADPVSTWSDSSASSNNATQATSGLRPTYRSGVINGRPVVRFDGSDDYLSLASTVTSNRAFTAFAVYKKRTTGVNMVPLGIDVSGGDNTGWPIYEYNNGYAYSSGNGGISNVSAEHTSFVVTSAEIVDERNQILYFNGAVQSISNLSIGLSPQPLKYVGLRQGDATSDGDIAEIVLYDSLISSVNRESVEDYLGGRYGITISH